jgi:hypothetical protein
MSFTSVCRSSALSKLTTHLPAHNSVNSQLSLNRRYSYIPFKILRFLLGTIVEAVENILFDLCTGLGDIIVAQWGANNLYSSPDIIRQIKSRRMRWAGLVARMGEGRNVYRVLVGKPRGKDHLKDQGIDGRLESKWTLGRLVGGGGGGGMDLPGLG